MRKDEVVKATVFISKKMNKQLKKIASSERISKTKLITNILESVLEQNEKMRKRGR